MQLTEAEAAFRIHKSDLQLRPVWHQKQERVEAHILVCFLAYVLWKTLAQMCRQAGLGDEPRKVFDELAQIMLVDIVLPTRTGITIRKRLYTCISDRDRHCRRPNSYRNWDRFDVYCRKQRDYVPDLFWDGYSLNNSFYLRS